MHKFIGAAAVLACGICSGTISAQNASDGVTSGPGSNAGQIDAPRRGPVLQGARFDGTVQRGPVLQGTGFDGAAQRGPVLQGVQRNGLVRQGMRMNGVVLQGVQRNGLELYRLPQYLAPAAAEASVPRSDWSAVRLDRVSVRLAQPAR